MVTTANTESKVPQRLSGHDFSLITDLVCMICWLHRGVKEKPLPHPHTVLPINAGSCLACNLSGASPSPILSLIDFNLCCDTTASTGNTLKLPTFTLKRRKCVYKLNFYERWVWSETFCQLYLQPLPLPSRLMVSDGKVSRSWKEQLIDRNFIQMK